MMDDPLPLSAAAKTAEMVGRQQPLQTIWQAMFAPGKGLRVVLIQADGGFGKTRLLEEVLSWRKPDAAASFAQQMEGVTPWSDQVIISKMIDLIDTPLQERDRFIHELRTRLDDPPRINFDRYDQAFAHLRDLRVRGASLMDVRRAATAAKNAFLEDLVEEKQRVVLVLDTAEQLSYVTSKWLIEKKLITAKDLERRTHQWLDDILSGGYEGKPLENITFLIAGRGQEGKPFFDSLKKAFRRGNGKGFPYDPLIHCPVKPFSAQETKQYFVNLAADWQARSQRDDAPPNAGWIADYFDYIAQAKEEPFRDTYRVLHLLTGGIPVRLALCAQLIVEGNQVPEPLTWSYKQARQEVARRGREAIQWDIEDEFIMLLFHQQQTLRGQILLTLVRAPRGLNATQLCYALEPGEPDVATWEPNPDRLREVTDTLKSMRDLYLVKRRASWYEVAALQTGDEQEQEAIRFRLGLQDEVYRIYAEHMAPFHPPITATAERIESYLQSSEITAKVNFEARRNNERDERETLYERLQAWANHQVAYYREQKRTFLKQDEATFEAHLRPNDKETFRLEPLSLGDITHRDEIQTAINTFQVEEMIYALARRTDYTLNVAYTDLAYFRYIANDEGQDFVTQTAAWHVINDPYGVYLKFVDFRERRDKKSPVKVLQQVLVQEDVSRWLKRFVIWTEYDRTQKLAAGVEREIERLQPKAGGKEDVERIRYTWNHTLSQGERNLWRAYAQIMAADDIPTANESLRKTLDNLQVLYTKTVKENVFSPHDGSSEWGFRGIPEEGIPDHPARNRIRRLLSYGSNILGYGCVLIGRLHEAVFHYNQGLHYLRGAQGEEEDKGDHSHRATVLNNLSRALADLGDDSTAVCLDGLRLRRNEAAEIPIAYSYNTLALIYDRLREPTRAWDDAAKAVAYFRRAEDRRGLALSLLQLASAMRHLAAQAQTGETAIASADQLCGIADGLLDESFKVFGEVGEPVRTIEILTERANLNRDRVRWSSGSSTTDEQREDYYQKAVADYNQALRLAQRCQLSKHLVDIYVNMAWLHFYAQRQRQVVTMLKRAIAMVEMVEKLDSGKNYFISASNRPQVNALSDPWVLPQLSKIYSLKAHMAKLAFNKRVDELAKRFPNVEQRHQKVHEDTKAQTHLKATAKNYTLAINYAQLFSPRTATISHLLSRLYDDLKASNPVELEDFHDYALKAEREYCGVMGEIVICPFLHRFLGLPSHDERSSNEHMHHDA